MSLNKYNILKVNPGAKSSRFLVDLKRKPTAEEIAERNKEIIIQIFIHNYRIL
jgi:hypothetical protein